MIVFPLLTTILFLINPALSQAAQQTTNTSTQASSPVSKKLDFDGIGGEKKDTCGYKKSGLCMFCIDGYQLSINFQCVSQSRCIKYNRKYECTQCADFLAFEAGDCIDKNCYQGPTRYKCPQCKKGYVHNEIGVCVAQGCISFKNGVCLECSEGRQLLNQICQLTVMIITNNLNSTTTNTKNIQNVTERMITTTTTTTTTTNSGGSLQNFHGNGGMSAETTIKIKRDGCLILDAEGKCARCQESYALAGASCIRKNSPCEQYSKSNGTCLKCRSNYTLADQVCILKGPPDHCSEYVNSSCLNCENGYYFVKGYCLQVDPLCKQYQKVFGACISCYDGYVLVEDRCSIRLSVPSNSSISIFDDTTTISVTNISILTNISIYYCLERNNEGLCVKCYERFYLRENLCIRVNHLCKNYTPDGKCSDCFEGYQLSDSLCAIDLKYSSKNNCVRHSENANMCLECENGFFRHSRGLCIQVLPSCKTYEISNGRCTSCYMGFFLANGFCQIIPTSLIVPFCRNYNPMDPRVCRQCVSGYYLQSNRCLPVSLSCVQYDEFSGSCISCLSSFILSEGNCLQQEAAQVLAPYCQEYNKSGMCLVCKESYQIINFVCIRK